MSFVENMILRKIQIVVSNKLFDYTGDFLAVVNVLLVSVSIVRLVVVQQEALRALKLGLMLSEKSHKVHMTIKVRGTKCSCLKLCS